MDRRFVVQKLNELGVQTTLEDFLRAHAVATLEIGRIMQSDEPGTDATRWQAYGARLMHELKVEGDALQRMREAILAKHMAGDLWTFVEEGTLETLRELRRAGFTLGIVSNADGRVATFVEKAGLAEFFDVIIDSGVVGVEKPDPRIFEIACEQLDVEPGETIHVGDIYEIDVLGARAAGIRAILLFNGDKDDAWDCDVIPRITALPAVLASTPLRPHASTP